MPIDSVRDLLVRGSAAARAREYPEARRYLEWALRMEPSIEQRVEIFYWLSECTLDPVEKRRLVEEALANNPGDMRLRRSLALLNGDLKAEEIVDPDHIPAPAPGELAQVDARRFTCPQCGGRMTYTPDGRSLTCEFCESRQSLQAGSSSRSASGLADPEPNTAESFLIAMATRKGHLHPTIRQTFFCQGCGADFMLAPQALTLTCPYCASTYVTRGANPRELIDPHALIPFQVESAQARQRLQAWFEEDPPGDEIQLEVPAALYLPVWSFEMAGLVPWSGMIKDENDQWVPETGQEIVYHASVLVAASRRLTPECAQELHGFDLRVAVPFDERYLAAWPAETYAISVGDASLEARRWTFEFEKQSVRGRLLRPVTNLVFRSQEITIESFRLVLLPLWIGHYQAGERRCEVVINGQNGHVSGQRPPRVSWLDRLLGGRQLR